MPSRGDRPKRQFGPDAKPFRARSHRVFKPEGGGKKSLKEKVGGQMYSVDDDDDLANTDVEVENFATSEGDEEGEQKD
jgi:hypothetical protein